MPYNNKKRKENSSNHKKAIIDAAKDLVRKNGYNNVSVEQICKAAGVAKGSFYIHYTAKDEIISDLIGDGFDNIKSNAKNIKGQESIRSFIIESVKMIMEAGLKTAQMWFSDAVRSSEYGRQKMKYDYDTIKELIEPWEDDKEIAEAISMKIISSYYGALVLWCISDGNIDPLSQVEKSLDKIIQ